MSAVVKLDLICDTFYKKVSGLWNTILEGFSKCICTNEATETSSMGDCAPGFFLSAYYFIPFQLCPVNVNEFKALVASEDYNRVIAANIHGIRMARMCKMQGSMPEWEA